MATSKRRRHPFLRYGMAVLAVIAVVGVLAAVGTGQRNGLGLLLFFAVLVSAWYGGMGPGLLTTALFVILTLIVILYQNRLTLPDLLPRLLALTMFSTGAVVITLLVEALHSARRRRGD